MLRLNYSNILLLGIVIAHMLPSVELLVAAITEQEELVYKFPSTVSSDGTSTDKFDYRKLVIGYAPVCELTPEESKDPAKIRTTKAYQAAKKGVNTLIWCFVTHLDIIEEKKVLKPDIKFWLTPNLTCIAGVMKALEEDKLPVMHMTSIGGWLNPHPDTRFSGKEWFHHFDKWSVDLSEQYLGRKGIRFFQGIDWDIEGHDEPDHPNNVFTVKVLDLVGEFSQEAKRHGYFNSLVPSEYLFDPTTHEFNRNNQNTPSDPWHPEFHFLGGNAYVYWVAKFPETVMPDKSVKRTFDVISTMLYESWGHFPYNMGVKGRTFKDYFAEYIKDFRDYHLQPVKFGSDKGLGFPDTHVQIDVAQQLVVGFARGNLPDEGRMLCVRPEEIEDAWNYLPQKGLPKPRGVMYWSVFDDGENLVNNTYTDKPIDFAQGFENFLHTRSSFTLELAAISSDFHEANVSKPEPVHLPQRSSSKQQQSKDLESSSKCEDEKPKAKEQNKSYWSW